MTEIIPESGSLLDDEYIKVQIHAKCEKWIELIHDIKKMAREALRCIEQRCNDRRAELMALSFCRIISNVEAFVIVIEYGHESQGGALLRGSMESMFRLIAIEKNPELAEQFDYESALERKKMLTKITLLKNPALKAKLSPTDETRAEIEESASKGNGKSISIEEYAKSADLHDWYLINYSIFSASVHGSVRDLQKHLELNDKGELTPILNESVYGGLNTLFDIGSNILLISFDSISRAFILAVPEWRTNLQNRLEELETKLPVNEQMQMGLDKDGSPI